MMKHLLISIIVMAGLGNCLCTQNNKYLDISYANRKYFILDSEKKTVIPLSRKLFDEGVALNDTKKYREAVQRFEQALEYYSPPEYYYHYGNGLSNLGEYARSIKAYEISIQLNYEKSYYSLYNIACCYSLLKNYDKSIEYLKNAIVNGYPGIQHLAKDNDLAYVRGMKAWDRDYKSLLKLYRDGNEINLEGKKIIHSYASSEDVYYFYPRGNSRVHYTISEDAHHNKFGTYQVKNYRIYLSWSKESGGKGVGAPLHCASRCSYARYADYEKNISENEILSYTEITGNEYGHWKIENHEEARDVPAAQPAARK